VLSSVVSSQVDLHARFGGVVPELAGRSHLERIVPVVDEAMSQARQHLGTEVVLDAVAATVGPGLIGSLLVGVSAAKSLAMAFGVPFVAVNHLDGHLHAAFLEADAIELPVVVLLVSGGHTMLVGVRQLGSYELLGETADDAAGEAFDKVARYLGLGYPGGPAIEKAAQDGDPQAIAFPRPMTGLGCELSFSGLKTAVTTLCPRAPAGVDARRRRLVPSCSGRRAGGKGPDRRGRALGRGGSASEVEWRPIRRCAIRSVRRASAPDLSVHLPRRAMCTDNAAMIAAAGWFLLGARGPSAWSTGAYPSLRLDLPLARST